MLPFSLNECIRWILDVFLFGSARVYVKRKTDPEIGGRGSHHAASNSRILHLLCSMQIEWKTCIFTLRQWYSFYGLWRATFTIKWTTSTVWAVCHCWQPAGGLPGSGGGGGRWKWHCVICDITSNWESGSDIRTVLEESILLSFCQAGLLDS